jgi:hypothetical protein
MTLHTVKIIACVLVTLSPLWVYPLLWVLRLAYTESFSTHRGAPS